MARNDKERAIYGPSWDAFHGGYFSDPAVAQPLIDGIIGAVAAARPGVVVDLGGGTGYVLARLRAAGVGPEVALVNLENSEEQIAAGRRAGLVCVQGSADAFRRSDIGPERECFLFLMRSVLHYFGRDGLRPALRHIRAQARPGEFFIHQTASFQRQPEADACNALYEMMGTRKWYPTVDVLCRCLKEEGWDVAEVAAGTPLVLTCEDLARRYGLDPARLLQIGRRVARDFPDGSGVFEHEARTFRAFLHYSIYVCSAAGAVE